MEIVEAKGELSIGATLGPSPSIGVGGDVNDGVYKADLAMKDVPEIKAEASISISILTTTSTTLLKLRQSRVMTTALSAFDVY